MDRSSAVLAALLLVACGPSTTTQVCTPGASESCTCPAGADGVRVCLEDGSGFGGCTMCGGAGGGSGGGGGSVGGGAGGGAGSPCTLPTAPTCGANARCDDTSGAAVCVCATGYQDNDNDTTCEPGCAVAGLSCGLHEVCDDSSGTAACVCAARYLPVDGGVDGGAACAWGGAPDDPGFNETPPGRWELSGGAVLDAGAQVLLMMDPGMVRFEKQVLCGDGGVPFARQTFDMPPFTAAEPMELMVSSRTLNTAGLPQWWAVVNGGWAVAPVNVATSYRQQAVCLGERAFEPGTTLALTAALRTFAVCSTAAMSDFEIDRVEVRPRATCPAPDALPNGDFEATTGWAAATTGTGATARLIADARVNGRGGRLTSTLRCASAALTATTSPLTTRSRADTAVEVLWTGTAGYELHVELEGRVAGVLASDGGVETSRVCVGEWARGMVTPLTFRLPLVTTTGCLNAEQRDFVVDDVRFVSDAECAAPARISDGSFERTQATPWVTSGVTGAVATLEQDGAQAKTGTGVLKVELTRTCASAEAEQPITVPPRQGVQGPAVTFSSRLPAGSSTTVSAVVDGVATTFAPTSNWRTHTVCLPAGFTGKAMTLALRGTSISTTCNVAQAAEAVYLDDVAVTTDPACPAQ